jgi:hypothetical protein
MLPSRPNLSGNHNQKPYTRAVGHSPFSCRRQDLGGSRNQKHPFDNIDVARSFQAANVRRLSQWISWTMPGDPAPVTLLRALPAVSQSLRRAQYDGAFLFLLIAIVTQSRTLSRPALDGLHIERPC